MIARDITHKVVMPVVLKTCVEYTFYAVEVATTNAGKCCIGNVVHIKVELSIEHACSEVACNEARTAISFANLIIHFIGKLFAHFVC